MEDCIRTERRGLHDYMKEGKEDMLSGALKEEFIKRKRDEKKKTLHEVKLQG